MILNVLVYVSAKFPYFLTKVYGIMTTSDPIIIRNQLTDFYET